MLKSDNPVPHSITYIHTLQKPVEEIQRLASFLELNREYEFIKAVAENCRFDVMKKRYNDTMEQMGAINFKAGAHFFRKGIFYLFLDTAE